MGVRNFIMNRMPNGSVYRTSNNYTKILKGIRDRKNYERGTYEFLRTARNIFYLYGSSYNHDYRVQKKLLKALKRNYTIIPDNMISVGSVNLPIPSVKEINLWCCEFIDLLVPYLFYKNEYLYNEIDDYFGEGPYEYTDDVKIEEGDIVIDCGANMGMFSTIASVRGASKVYAFEPSQEIIDCYLSKTVESNKGIEIEPYALLDYEGITSFEDNSQNIGMSKTVSNGEAHQNAIEIKAISIDKFVEHNQIGHIDFIKCDIEGAERYMLRGATKTLKDYQPKLAICTYHYKEDPKLLEDIILQANPKYVVKHAYKKLYAYVPKEK